MVTIGTSGAHFSLFHISGKSFGGSGEGCVMAKGDYAVGGIIKGNERV